MILRKIHAFICLITIFCCLSNPLWSQSLVLEKVPLNLPSKTIHHIYSDSKGFLWLCTDNGLCRWDGRKVRIYNTQDGLPSNSIFKVFEDNRKRLWISSFNNRACFIERGVVHNAQNTPILRSFEIEFASSMIEMDSMIYLKKKNDKNYDIYLCLQNKSNQLILHKEIRTKALVEKILSQFKSGLIKENYSLEYWLNELSNYSFKKNERFVNINEHCLITFDKDEDLFHFYNRQLTRIKSSSSLYPYYVMIDSAVITFSKDSLFYAKANSVISINGRFRNGCSVDREGNFYAINRDGVYQIRNYNIFNKSTEDDEYQTTLATKEDIYIASSKRINALLSKKTALISNDQKLGVDLIIRKMIQLKGGEVIVCTNTGEYILNVKSGGIQQTKYSLMLDSLVHDYLPNKSMYRISDSTYLASSSAATYYIQNYPIKKIIPVRSGRSYGLYLSSKGTLFISTLDGLQQAYFDRTALNQLIFKKTPLGPTPCFVNAIEEDKNGNIILSTNEGLKFLKFNRVIDCPFLKGVECMKAMIDFADNSLWVATSNGLYHIRYSLNGQPTFNLIKRYLDIDGLPSNEIKDMDRRGDTIILLNPNGYALLNTRLPTLENYEIPIYLDGVFKNDTNAIVKDEFNYDDNNIQFAFSAPYFKRNRQLQFQYRLKGAHQVEMTKDESSINFLSLEPGSYTLMVRAMDKDNAQIKSNWLTISFKVNPPYWATWWFRLLMISLFLFALIILVRLYIQYEKNKLRREQEIFNRISSVELKSLRAQMNPHFIFNCLNSIKDYLYKKDFEATAKYLSKFASLIRKSLNMSRSNYTNIDEEIAFLDTYCLLEQMRFSMQFDYQIINKNLPEDYELPTLMIQPFVENSIRHGQIGNLPYKGILVITFELIGQDLHCTIEDNGIGYEQGLVNKSNKINEEESKSLNIFEERISLYRLVYETDIEMNMVDKNKHGEKGTIVNIILKQSITA